MTSVPSKKIKILLLTLVVVGFSCSREVPPHKVSKSPIHIIKELTGMKLNRVKVLDNGEMALAGYLGPSACLAILHQDGSLKWHKTLYFGGFNEYLDVVPMDLGRFLTVGRTTSHDVGVRGSFSNPLMAIHEPDGELRWQGTLPVPNSGSFDAATIMDNGDITAVGYYSDGTLYSHLVRFDQNLNIISGLIYTIGPYRSRLFEVFEEGGDRIRTFGYSSQSNTSGINGGISRYQTFQLNLDWQDSAISNYVVYSDHAREPYFSGQVDSKIRVVQEAHGGYTWATTEEIPGPGFRIHFVQADPLGNVINDRDIRGLGNAFVHKLIPTSDGGYLLLGSSTDQTITYFGLSNSTRMMVMKLDASGNQVWVSHFGSEFQVQEAIGAKEGADHYLIVGQQRNRESYNDFEPLYLMIDKNGELLEHE